MSHAYTEPSRSMLLFYRFVYDPLRSRQLRRLVFSLGLDGSERVLVFGSGAGSEATYVAVALKRGRVTCLDVSGAWLAEARRRLRRHSNVDFVLGEAPEVGLEPASFDLILAHYSIHDVDRSALPATLTALARALKAGWSRWSRPPATTSITPCRRKNCATTWPRSVSKRSLARRSLRCPAGRTNRSSGSAARACCVAPASSSDPHWVRTYPAATARSRNDRSLNRTDVHETCYWLRSMLLYA